MPLEIRPGKPPHYFRLSRKHRIHDSCARFIACLEGAEVYECDVQVIEWLTGGRVRPRALFRTNDAVAHMEAVRIVVECYPPLALARGREASQETVDAAIEAFPVPDRARRIAVGIVVAVALLALLAWLLTWIW